MFHISGLTVNAQSFKVSYYGETVLHYGIKAGYEHQLGEKIKINSKGDTSSRALIFSPALAMYHHPQNHTGIILAPEFFYRRTGSSGGLFETGISTSFFRYFLSGTTYEVTDKGEFRKVPFAGRNTILPTVFIGIGRDLMVKHKFPIAWYARFNLSIQYPYNASFLPRFAFEAGVIKKISIFKNN